MIALAGFVKVRWLLMSRDILRQVNLKYILVSPYPTLFLRYGSVGRIFFFSLKLKTHQPSNIAIKLNTNNAEIIKMFYLTIKVNFWF